MANYFIHIYDSGIPVCVINDLTYRQAEKVYGNYQMIHCSAGITLSGQDGTILLRAGKVPSTD